MPRLLVIVASTRPGRVGLPVARWFVARAQQHGAFAVEVADLAELALPFMDEPHHPRLGRYTHKHTKRWSATVAAADAFAFVMPEYNHGMTAPLKNAIDFLHAEWRYKPVGFVSYGGVSGGTRAVQMARQTVASLKMMAILEAVAIPFVAQRLDDARELRADEPLDGAAAAMLDELARVSAALEALRPRAGSAQQEVA
jgi:NAD(P)H-dependent FMN reductase